MRSCNFERIIRKLLKEGIVYIGASAGSMVVGRTIQTANKFGTGNNGNNVGLKNLKGLNLVPFDIFAHYTPEYAELVEKKVQRYKYPLKILTDEQAILVQGKEVALIGQGELIEFKKKTSVLRIIFMAVGIIFVILAVSYLLNKADGILQGKVSIGPICPVERVGQSCPVPKEAYTQREVIVYSSDGKKIIARMNFSDTGTYKFVLPEGDYVVDIPKTGGLGSSKELPYNVSVGASQPTEFDFSIDTGIR